jgi:hypothetical protein
MTFFSGGIAAGSLPEAASDCNILQDISHYCRPQDL